MKRYNTNIAILVIIFTMLFMGFNVKAGLADNLRPSAEEIPSGTIIIGTHLISFNVLNQEILTIALKSAEDSMLGEPEEIQVRIYYKSELNNGVWYDITSAASILDITISSNMAVTNAHIDGLLLTHWTKSDGVTIEFASGRNVRLHDINSPKNPGNMSELAVLGMEREVQEGTYQALVDNYGDKDLIEKTKAKLASMDRIFEPIEDIALINFDRLLDFYDGFIKYLINDKKASDRIIAIALEYKDNVLAQRDFMTYEIMLERLNEELIVASFLEDADLIGKYGTTMDQVHQKLSQLLIDLEEMPEEKVLDQMYGQFAENLQRLVMAVRYEAAYEELLKMQAINSIYDNIILDRELEIEIISEAKKILLELTKELFAQGEPEEYKDAKGRGEANTVLEGIKRDALHQYKNRLDEMDELQQYYLFRVGSEPGLQLDAMEELLAQLNQISDSLPEDDLSNDVADLLDDMLDIHNKMLAQLKVSQTKELFDQIAAVENLRSQGEQLQEQYFAAAEKGDFAQMNQVKEQLDSLNALIDEQQDQAAQKYSDLIDKKNHLEENLVNAESAEERNELRGQLGDLLTQLAGLEPLLDEKARNSLQDLEDLKKELKDALDKNDLRLADNIAGELISLLNIMPDNLFSEEQKNSQVEGMVAQFTNKAEQLERNGNSGTAQNVMVMANAIKDSIADEKVDAPILPTVPPYYLVFVDHDVRIANPYVIIDDVVYVPSRLVFEALGAKIIWQPEQGRVIIQDRAHHLLLEYTVNQETAYLNDRRIRLPRVVDNLNGVTYLPLQVILDGYRMKSEMKDQVIYIYK